MYMVHLFLPILPDGSGEMYSKGYYEKLKQRKQEIEKELTQLNNELFHLNSLFKVLDGVYDPHITIVEVDNKSMGHRYIGKFRCYLETPAKACTINLGMVKVLEQQFTNFQGKADPRLLVLAKEKATEYQINKYPHFFTAE